jgi:Xaa-Pro aminopeptidase
MSKMVSDVYGRWPYTWEEREKVLELEFPMAEYHSRIARAREEMDRIGLDVLLVHGAQGGKSNVRYLSGYESFFGDTFVVLHKVRDPILITNSILHGEPMHSNIQVTWVRDFRPSLGFGTTLNMQSPVDYVKEALAEFGLTGKRIGLVDARKISAATDRELREKLAGYEIVDATSIMVKLRRIKSPAEIEVIRTLAGAASLGMEAALQAAVPGASEHDVAAALYFASFTAGCDLAPFGMHIQSGTRSAMKNVLPKKGKIIQEGEIVAIDSSLEFLGYQSDHARSTIAGTGTPEQVHLLEACLEAWEVGIATAGPGVPISEVVLAMEGVSRRHGFAEWDWSCGHGFGLDLVEDPIIVRDNHARLEVGQTFFIEPMIVPTHMGTACFEDLILITETGAECLTTSRLRTW